MGQAAQMRVFPAKKVVVHFHLGLPHMYRGLGPLAGQGIAFELELLDAGPELFVLGAELLEHLLPLVAEASDGLGVLGLLGGGVDAPGGGVLGFGLGRGGGDGHGG